MEDWGGEISEQNVPVLILIEGLTMYLNAPLRGRCPEGAEGENLAIARNISGSRTVLSPTACGRSPSGPGPSVASRHLPTLWGVTLAEGAKGWAHLFRQAGRMSFFENTRKPTGFGGKVMMNLFHVLFAVLEPKDTAVYKLIATKPGEAASEG